MSALSIRKLAVVTIVSMVTVPLVASYGKLTSELGSDGFLSKVLMGLENFFSQVIDPDLAWMFWLGIGLWVGAASHSMIRRREEATMRRPGGPTLQSIRRTSRWIRWAIALPWLRRLSHDFESDLVWLNSALTDIHGFPPLPSSTFENGLELIQTSEYLRRIIPHLTAEHLGEAKFSAIRYCRQLDSARSVTH